MKLLLVVLSFFLFTNIFSQKVISVKLDWNSENQIDGERIISFEGASFNEDFLPIFNKNLKVDKDNYKVDIANKVFKSIDGLSMKKLEKKLLKNMLKVYSDVYKNKNENILFISFVPLRINPKTNDIEKLVSFDIKYIPISKNKSKQSFNTANVSEMSTGDWFKIGIVKSGMYKVTYDQIVNWGIDSPNNPRIFGYGGKVLPENNDEYMPDDMNEMAIEVEKGADGIFNSGDYILFYAEGPLTWDYNEDNQQFYHYQHLYSDTIFYFLSLNTGETKLINTIGQNSNSGLSINVYLDKVVYEKDEVNLLSSGKVWLGEEYNNLHESRSFDFSFPDLVTDSLVNIQAYCAARCSDFSYLNVYYNNQKVQSLRIPNVNMSSATSFYVRNATDFDSFYVNSSSFTINTIYDKFQQYNAWLDYIRVSAVRPLKVVDSQLLFTNVYNKGGVNQYNISNVNDSYEVWNVSDLDNIHKISRDYSNSIISFKDDVSNYKTYVVVQPSTVQSIASVRTVNNQNLHGLENIEYVILTHRNFKTQAEEIANYHRTYSGLNTVVVTNEEVYNEFSSGTPDITATKNFMRHLYHNKSNTDTLKYLLLFGDGSYDNKTQSSSNSNYILTYQSAGSIRVNGTFVSDDYYGLLDENEGAITGFLDIGIGRIVVKSISEAKSAVNKIINYNKSNASYGDWRSLINFVADNGDGNLHIRDADYLASLVESSYPEFNISKIYMDAYPLEESAGGNIVPEATRDFNMAINKGTLILNYTGHGGELGLAHEQLITNQDIQSWNNSKKLAVFVTATCEFTRYDDKDRVSAGELVFLNENGGGISLFTTTRIAYAGPNKIINTAFYNHLFDDDKFRMGDLIRRTKNSIGATSTNMRIFTLIGDPALSMAIPKKKVTTIKINDILVDNVDTINLTPLSKVTITGELRDVNNQIMSDFNGIVYPTVFDKADTILTLCQFECTTAFPFKDRENIIYKGKVSVKDGRFSFSFVVPKDVSYKNGLGRISYYADNKNIDAWGYNNNIGISGLSDTSITDNKGPDIELFMNDENFIFGGTTDENPVFIASLFDENGINTVGNGIGHDLTAKLNNDNRKLSVLNSYYESDLDSYQSGKVSYPYSKLEKGKNTIYFKAWDVFNNSSEQTIEFYVAESVDLAIKNIFNYPNPFTTNTDFYFDHNQANKNLDVLIQIFTVSGKLVKTIETNILTDGFRSTPINWNGKDDFNDPIGKGVYIYKLKVKSEDGQVATEFQKLVILK